MPPDAVQPLGKLLDDGHGRAALVRLWLLPVASPVRLRNAKLFTVVVFPSEAAQFAFACPVYAAAATIVAAGSGRHLSICVISSKE